MRKLLLFIVISFTVATAQNSNDFKVGLALRGGGALGFAHIGALHVIDSLDIPISYVAGTSMGGLVGALYSMGLSTQQMQEFIVNLNWAEIFDDTPSRDMIPYHIKKNSGIYQLSMELSGFAPTLPSGIVAGQKIYNTFFQITYPFEGIKSFDDLPIPFRCIGADLVTGNEIIFSDGSLAKAMRATMSIPTAFAPVKYDTAMVVDGGMTNNFPVDVAQKMGSDFVIGLNLVSTPHDADYYNNLMTIIDRTLDVPRKDKLQATIDAADLLIQQDISGYSLSDFEKSKILEIINRGKIAAYEVIDQLVLLKNRINSAKRRDTNQNKPILSQIKVSGDPDYSEARIEKILWVKTGKPFNETIMKSRLDRFNKASHLIAIEADLKKDSTENGELNVLVKKNLMPVLKSVKVTGHKNISEDFILQFLGLTPQQRLDIYQFEYNVSLLYGLKYFSVIRYNIDQNDDDTISLDVEVVESALSRFRFGLHYNDYHKLVGAIGISGTPIWVPGLFYDFRVQFSGLTRFETEILYPTRSIDFPFYPLLSGGYQSIPRDFYDTNGNKVLKYDERYWYFGGGVGLTPLNYLNLRGAILFEYPNIQLDIGEIEDEPDSFNDNIISLYGDLAVDLLDNVLIPKEGIKLNADLEYSSTDLGSNYDYVRFKSQIDLYKTIASIHTFRLHAQYLQSAEDEPFHKTTFFIGGPQSFFGLEYNQGFGTRFAIARADYIIQVLTGIYIRGVVNASPIYRLGLSKNFHTGSTLWGFGFGMIYNSVLGPVEIDFTWGEKNTYQPGTYLPRFYFTAGYNL